MFPNFVRTEALLMGTAGEADATRSDGRGANGSSARRPPCSGGKQGPRSQRAVLPTGRATVFQVTTRKCFPGSHSVPGEGRGD